jgi:transposase
MDIVHPICCGIDVHKKSLTACLLTCGASGRAVQEVRTFGTFSADLQRLVDWLQQAACPQVALESNGVYWKPVYNLLEQARIGVLLINPQHAKALHGRKTDRLDAGRLAELLRHGLLAASFIPPKDIRQLRELTRYRATLVRQRADECNRIQKLLENGNVKLASVATDVLGVSGRAMLSALATGQDNPEILAQMARGRLRQKIPALVEALRGQLSVTDRWLLGEHLGRVAELDAARERVDDRVREQTRPFEDQLKRLDEIPGVNRRIAEVIIAEIGVNMEQFASAGHLASWSGMCPGNHESAGKRHSGRRRWGNVWLRAVLAEAGWAAGRAHTKQSQLYAQYRRLVGRRGKKRACIAVGHSILRIAYDLLKTGKHYHDLGADYYEQRDRERRTERLLRQLRPLGVEVTVKDPAA